MMKNLRVIITSLPGTWQRLLINQIESFASVKVIGVADGGLTAVELVKRHPPDLICIDASIPTNDAIAVVEKIKQDHPEIVTVVIADTHQQRLRFHNAGVDYAFSTYKFSDQMSAMLAKLTDSLKTQADNDDNIVLS